MESKIEKLYGISKQSAPKRMIVLTPNAHLARWTQRSLLDIGPVIGAEVYDVDSFLLQTSSALLGEPIPQSGLLALVQAALSTIPVFGEVAANSTYQSAVLRQFIEIHRACSESPISTKTISSRDEDLLQAFLVFRTELEKSYAGRWYAGNAPRLLAPHANDFALLRDSKSFVLFGFIPSSAKDSSAPSWLNAPSWLGSWTQALGKPLTVIDCGAEPHGQFRASLFACSGPEAEIASVARLLRGEVRNTTVLVPADEIPRWVQRLAHRDIPMRAFVPRPLTDTAVAKMFAALASALTAERVEKSDLGLILFGPALRAFKWAEGKLEADGKNDDGLSTSLIYKLWKEIRRRSGTLTEWIVRIRAVLARKQQGWNLQDQKRTPTDYDLKSRTAEALAGEALILCLQELLARRSSNKSIHGLLKDWRIDQSANAHKDFGSREIAAAALITDELKAAFDLPPASVLPLILDRLNAASDGYWLDEQPTDGSAPVFIAPYEAAGISFTPRMILCGLDRVPASVPPSSLFSHGCLASLGVLTDQDRYDGQCRMLDALTHAEQLVVTWRTKDALGAACAPSAWTASRFLTGEEKISRVGSECLAAPLSDAPVSWLEWQTRHPDGELKNRVSAVAGLHFEKTTNCHAGALGVTFKPPYYSVSALQKFAALPYAYFLNYVLKLKEEKEIEDSLDAAEQGTLMHSAMETPLRERLQTTPPIAVNVCKDRAILREQTQNALAEEYESGNDQVLSEAVWQGDRSRWQKELAEWWTSLEDRMDNSPKDDPMLFEPFRQAQSGELERWYAQGDFEAIQRWWEAATKKLVALQGEDESPVEFKLLEKLVKWLSLKASPDVSQWQDEKDRQKAFGTRNAGLRLAVDEWLKPEAERDRVPISKIEAELTGEIIRVKKAIKARLEKLFQAYVEAPGCEVVAVEMSLGTKEEPIRLQLADDVEISIYGSVDRLECDPIRGRLCICDYKTGGSHNERKLLKKINEGEHLQLPLYALAVDTMSDDKKPFVTEAHPLRVGAIRLEFIKRKKTDKGGVYQPCALAPSQSTDGKEGGLSVVDVAKDRAAEIVRSIERGEYPLEARTDSTRYYKREQEVMRIVREGKTIKPQTGKTNETPQGSEVAQ